MINSASPKGDEVNSDFKSKFLSDAEKMKQQLSTVSSSLCLAKWKQVSLHLTTGHTNSCYHPPLHKIETADIAENPAGLHNTAHKKQQRWMMLNDTRPSECDYCWNMEDKGQLSDRHYRSGEPWAAKDFSNIVSQPWDTDATPSYVEVNFSNACNLKCSYCSPQFSSSWQSEVNQFGAYPTTVPHNAPEHFAGTRRPIPLREYNPYVEAFWKWWPTLYPELEHFRMTGGEPLLDKNTFKVFDYVLEHPKPNLHLSVTSNFSVEHEVLFSKYMSYVTRLCTEGTLEHFMQYVSVDAWGSKAEYIRNGLVFDTMWDRVHRFLTEAPYRNSLTFIITMNNLSVTSLQQLLENILKLRKQYSKTYQRIWFDTPVLRQPHWQSMQLLPPSYVMVLQRAVEFMKQNIETEDTRFCGFKDYEIQRLERDIAWMQTPVDAHAKSTAMADFYKFFSEHDRRRATNFIETFPEMKHWWNDCATAAQQQGRK